MPIFEGDFFARFVIWVNISHLNLNSYANEVLFENNKMIIKNGIKY